MNLNATKCTFVEAVLTSTHNLCFGAKIRNIGIPLKNPFFYIKVGYKGVYISRTCFPDDMILIAILNIGLEPVYHFPAENNLKLVYML